MIIIVNVILRYTSGPVLAESRIGPPQGLAFWAKESEPASAILARMAKHAQKCVVQHFRRLLIQTSNPNTRGF